MLGGKGVYRGSNLLLSGTSGTGKTSVVARFAHASCARGERCLYFAFEESPQQIVRNMRSIGTDLQPGIKKGLLKIVDLVPSPWIGVNWDTGNAYLAGVEDPYEALERVRDRVLHVHAKDISYAHSEAERGKVTGTPVGCACGEGVVDWERILRILEPLEREIFLSVECGRIDEAERSLTFLQKTAGDRLLAN